MGEFIVGAAGGATLGFFVTMIGLMSGVDSINRSIIGSQWEREAIERDYGEYCSRTGEWAWIGECE